MLSEALYDALFSATEKELAELRTVVALRLWEDGTYPAIMGFVRRCCVAGCDGLDVGVDTLALAARSGLDLYAVVRNFWASERPDWAGRYSQYRWQNDAWHILLRAMARGCPDQDHSLAILAPFTAVESSDLRDIAIDALNDLHTPGARAILDGRKRVESDPRVLRSINLYLAEWDLA